MADLRVGDCCLIPEAFQTLKTHGPAHELLTRVCWESSDTVNWDAQVR